MIQTYNINIERISPLSSPRELKERIPLSDRMAANVARARASIEHILEGEDQRKLVIVGPCSIHDLSQAIEYATRLKTLSDQMSDEIFIIMRTYFEKPRTTVGWKGLINDPDLNGTYDINKGLFQARSLLTALAELDVPTATETLDVTTPQYLSDAITYASIGARTTESQVHREMASGLSMPVGFKNGTTGNIDIAINAIKSAYAPHAFLGVNEEGKTSVFHTRGNKYAHLILRGSDVDSNCDERSVVCALKQMGAAGLQPTLVIDCSHGNSRKDHIRQPAVCRDILRQMVQGNNAIKGIMLESNLHEGSQDFVVKPLRYGISLTDKCMSWETTEMVLYEAYDSLKKMRKCEPQYS